MKRVNLCFLAFLITFIACEQDKKGCRDQYAINYDPDAVLNEGCEYAGSSKRTLVVYFGNVNSSACGTFALPLYQNTKINNPNNVSFITAHPNASDPLLSSAAVNLASILSISSQPNFCVASTSNLIVESQIQSEINNDLATSSNGVGVSTRMTITGDSITVTNFGKLINNVDSFFIANYVLERGVANLQSGIVGMYYHDNVLRTASGSSGIGELIEDTDLSTFFSFKKEYTLPLNPIWDYSKISIVSVLWKKSGSQITYINSAVN